MIGPTLPLASVWDTIKLWPSRARMEKNGDLHVEVAVQGTEETGRQRQVTGDAKLLDGSTTILVPTPSRDPKGQ